MHCHMYTLEVYARRKGDEQDYVKSEDQQEEKSSAGKLHIKNENNASDGEGELVPLDALDADKPKDMFHRSLNVLIFHFSFFAI